jgi:hypothetical protein
LSLLPNASLPNVHLSHQVNITLCIYIYIHLNFELAIALRKANFVWITQKQKAEQMQAGEAGRQAGSTQAGRQGGNKFIRRSKYRGGGGNAAATACTKAVSNILQS